MDAQGRVRLVIIEEWNIIVVEGRKYSEVGAFVLEYKKCKM